MQSPVPPGTVCGLGVCGLGVWLGPGILGRVGGLGILGLGLVVGAVGLRVERAWLRVRA